MRFSDTMLGGMLLAFAAAVAAYSWTLPAIPGQQYGAATFPLLVAAGFAGCGVMLLIRGLREGGMPLVARSDWTRRPGALTGVVITIVLVVAYILFSRRVGFIPMMTGILVISFWLLRVPWWQNLPLAVASTLVIDYVFRTVLLVPLPLGVMPRLPW